MSKKLTSISLAIVSGTALAWGAASCSSSTTPAGDAGPGGSSSGSGSSSSSSGSGSSSGSSSSSSSSGGSSSSSGGSGGDAGDGGGSLFACTGSAAGLTLIDDQSAPTGTAIALKTVLTPAACGNTGTWFDYNSTGGTVTSPVGTFAFSTQPAGLPADAGVPTLDASVSADGGDAGPLGPRAACFNGVTGPAQYATSGEGLNFVTLPSPDGGNALQVPIDASSHTGVQFWAWGGGDAGTQSIIVALSDKNTTPGLGTPGMMTGTGQFCDPTNGGATACGQATHTVQFAAGWQLIKIPFALFADNPGYGEMNETGLDPTSLTQLQWQIQQPVADAGGGVPFNFCIYGISFY
jgi:hypothetical protein